MPNALYARLQATAQRIITKYGQIGSIARVSRPDPVEGGDGAENTYAAKLVPMTYEQRYVDGSTILANDRQIYISSVGLAIEPQVGDIVTAGGDRFHVMAADTNNYDGVRNVVFIVQGRVAP